MVFVCGYILTIRGMWRTNMTIRIRLDGYPLYAFVPEWMVVAYVIATFGFWFMLKEKYDG